MTGTQGELDWTRTHHHTDDPDTSAQAAASVQETAKQHSAAILRVIESSPVPIAAESIGDRLALTTLQTMKRCSDLKNQEIIVDSGGRHRNRSGKWAVKWRLKQD